MPDKEKIIENYVEPDITVEYIFIEKAEKQIKPINDDDLMDNDFFKALISSLRNLMLVGKNFDLEKFKHHKIFEEWFGKYSNRI